MKKIIYASLLLLFTQSICTQSIQLYANGGLTIHTANISRENPPFPPEVPSIGVFYSAAPILGAKALYCFNDLGTAGSSFFAGVLYEYSVLPSEINDNVLGNDLRINTTGFSLGYKTEAGDTGSGIFLTFSLEYLKKFYSGYNDFGSGITSTSAYKNGSAFRGAIGAEFFISGELPLIFGVAFSMEFGTVRRDEVKFYYNDEYQESLDPAGDLVLPDNVINISMNFSYLFSL